MTAISKAAVTAATQPIALMAIAHHIEEHKLLVPNTITFDHDDPRAVLFLDIDAAPKWVASIHVDSEDVVTDTTHPSGWAPVVVDGRLPALGIQVRLRYLRRTVRGVA
jgi:hypothetical protein